MTIRTHIAAALFFITASASILAQKPPSADDVSTARRLYEYAPVKKFVDNVSGSINGGISSVRKQSGLRYVKELRVIQATLDSAFSSEILHGRTIEHLARIVAEEPDHAARVAEWLQTPETIKVREADIEANHPSDEETINTFYEEIDTESDSMADRLNLLAEIQTMERMPEQSVVVSWILLESLYALVNVKITGPRGEAAVPPPVLDDTLRGVMEQKLGVNILTSRIYLYRDLTDDEIINYGLFLDTESGRWYSDAIIRAMTAAYRDIASELETRMKNKEN